MRKTCLMWLVVVAMVPGAALSANLVTNPGFETGDFTGWSQTGNTGFAGVAGGVAHSGSFEAFFGPVGSLGGISQVLATVPGETYDLTFWLATDGGTPSEYLVSWGGVTLTDVLNPPALAYTEISFSPTAPSSSTSLGFLFRDDPGFIFLDDVSVVSSASQVPEPCSSLLLGFGLLGLWGARRKFRK